MDAGWAGPSDAVGREPRVSRARAGAHAAAGAPTVPPAVDLPTLPPPSPAPRRSPFLTAQERRHVKALVGLLGSLHVGPGPQVGHWPSALWRVRIQRKIRHAPPRDGQPRAALAIAHQRAGRV